MKTKIALYSLWVLATLPLLVYPLVLTDAWELLSAPEYYDGPAGDAWLAVAVGIMWLAYPVVFVVGAYRFWGLVKQPSRVRAAVWATALPVGYLLAFVLLTAVWFRAEQATIEAHRKDEMHRPSGPVRGDR